MPLVFIHGTLDDHHAWAAVAAKLAQKISNPMVLFDLRGHSASLNEAKGLARSYKMLRMC